MKNPQHWWQRGRAIVLNTFSARNVTNIAAVASVTALSLSVVSIPQAASAQAAYGSYIGVGGSFGLNSPDGQDSSAGGVVAARYQFLEVPLSLRAQVLIGDQVAIVPTVSYDIPLSWQADAYIGAGVAFQTGGDGSTESSPIGNQTSFVIQPGIDYAFPYSDLVLFGNAIIAFDAYRNSSEAAASVQGGLGLRF